MASLTDFTISFDSPDEEGWIGEALAAFLHDRDLLGQKWACEGIEQLRRGELVER